MPNKLGYIRSTRGDSRNFVEWFPEQLQLSRQIQGFIKGGAFLVVDP